MRYALIAVALLSAACGDIPANPTSPVNVTPPTVVARAVHLTSDPGTLPVGGGSATIHIEVVGSNGAGVSSAPVVLTVTAGTLEAESTTTDRSGHAKLRWQGTQAATVTARTGDIAGTLTIAVEVPPVIPPPSTPPPPAPEPPAPPPPAPQPPAFQVLMSASVPSAPVGRLLTFTVTDYINLNGEGITAFQWDFNGDGLPDRTTVTASCDHAFSSAGFQTARVTVTTTGGRTASASAQVVITN